MKYDFIVNKRKIIVTAKIKGIKSERDFDFILDTGASKSIIDSSVASTLDFDFKKLQSERLTTVSGGINSKILKLPKFSLFGKDIANFEVNVLDIPPQIMYFANGLIGMDFLLRFQSIKFDFNAKIIET